MDGSTMSLVYITSRLYEGHLTMSGGNLKYYTGRLYVQRQISGPPWDFDQHMHEAMDYVRQLNKYVKKKKERKEENRAEGDKDFVDWSKTKYIFITMDHYNGLVMSPEYIPSKLYRGHLTMSGGNAGYYTGRPYMLRQSGGLPRVITQPFNEAMQ